MAQPEPEGRVATYADAEESAGIEAEPDVEESGPLDLDDPIVCLRRGERRDSFRVELDGAEVERAIRKALHEVGMVLPEGAVFNVSTERGACFAWDVDSVIELEGRRL